MPGGLEALLYGIGATLPLVAGSAVGARLDVPDGVVAAALGFAAGALIAAFAFELVEQPFRESGALITGGGLLAGATVFIAIDTWLDRRSDGNPAGGGLLAGVTLDGIPENIALGVSLVGGNSLVLLAAIFWSNFPESLSGAAAMRQNGMRPARVMLVWAGAAVLLAAAVVGGRALATTLGSEALSGARAFAGGAVLASVADTVMPEAFRRGGPSVAYATTLGFFGAFMLSTI